MHRSLLLLSAAALLAASPAVAVKRKVAPAAVAKPAAATASAPAASPAAAVAAPKAATFEELLVGAKQPDDLAAALDPLFAQCAKVPEPTMASRQCTITRAWDYERARTARFLALADAAAMQAAPYDATSKTVTLTIAGCLDCKQPLLVGGAPRLLATRAAKGFADGVPLGIDLGEHEVTIDPAKARKWTEKTLPRLRVEMVFAVGDPFEAVVKGAPAKQWLAVNTLGYRVYDSCSGEVVASQPPSKKSKEIAEAARDPSCPALGAPTEDEVAQAQEQAGLPDTLTRSDIERAMAPVTQRVAECGMVLEIEGRAKVNFTVNPDGTMSQLKIAPPFDKGEVSLCMRQALKQATFPRYKQGRVIPVEYPFVLHK